MNSEEVFKIRTQTDFEKSALKIFRLQAEKNAIYKKYIQQLGVKAEKVNVISRIPFLPIEFFKSNKIITKPPVSRPPSHVFLSSGTTRMKRSKHHVSDIKLYEKSFRKGFEIFYGEVKQYHMLAFLPSYYENKNSSLLYMVNDLMKSSGKKESRFYKSNEQKLLLDTIKNLLTGKKKVILFGVSYALLDLTPPAQGLSPLSHDLTPNPSPKTGEGSSSLFVIETGGMKGRREEITREELHKILSEKFGVKKIHSEYGMTELLSQAYSTGDGIFKSPPWMKIFVREVNDPFSFLTHGKTGALNIIDLANINSCSFIATQDVGRTHNDGSFEVLGRMDNSDLRGCNLLAG